jgi:hypothetical protein
MNGIKVVDKLLICKVGSVYFWHRIHPKKLRILQEMVQSFHEVQSKRLFTVLACAGDRVVLLLLSFIVSARVMRGYLLLVRSRARRGPSTHARRIEETCNRITTINEPRFELLQSARISGRLVRECETVRLRLTSARWAASISWSRSSAIAKVFRFVVTWCLWFALHFLRSHLYFQFSVKCWKALVFIHLAVKNDDDSNQLWICCPFEL